MDATLVLCEPILGELEKKVRLPVESGAVLLARCCRTGNGNLRLLARSIHWVPRSAYIRRTSREMLVPSEGYVPALGAAEQDNAVPIWLHTHPAGEPSPSDKDRQVDAALADVFRLRSGADLYGTVIVSPQPNGLAFTGTVQKADSGPGAIDRFWMVGDRWRLAEPFDSNRTAFDSGMFDRNIRAFGEPVQRTIGLLRIAVVGAGGTGSAVAEQLVRLGARHMILADADTLSESNLTRVYGATPDQVSRPKAEALAVHLTSIAPDLRCRTVRGMSTTERVARVLTGADLIFGCTDDNAGRLVLSRLSAYYLTPVIDLGVLLSSDSQNRLEGIHGRVTVMSPGQACLLCRGRVDTVRAAAEMMTPEERNRLADEGYAPALGQAEPAVVSFTTITAALAVSELLERLVGYGDLPRPSEVLLRLHDREISGNSAAPRPGHICDPGAGKLGLGDTEPFLEQVWAA